MKAFTNLERESSFAVRGNRFFVQNEMIFDRFFSDSITPPALDAGIRDRLCRALNHSRYNLDLVCRPVSLWMENGRETIGNLDEPLSVQDYLN